MEKTGFLLVFLFFVLSGNVFGQENGALKHFYGSSEAYAAGLGMNLNNSDFGIFGYDVSIGYAFDSGISLFCPVDLQVGMYNTKSTKNYNNQGTIGIGAGYMYKFKESYEMLEFRLSGASTMADRDINYFSTGFSIRYGIKVGHISPFTGVGVMYLSPYDSAVKDKAMLCVSFGVRIL